MNSTVPAPSSPRPGQRPQRPRPSGGAGPRVMPGRGASSEHFLVAALHASNRAQTDKRSCRGVSPNTWISMWRGRSHVPFDQHSMRCQSCRWLRAGSWPRRRRSLRVCSTRRMPLPPPPALALIEHGVANAVGLALQQGGVLVFALVAGYQGHTGLVHQLLGLRPSGPWRGWRRPAGR